MCFIFLNYISVQYLSYNLLEYQNGILFLSIFRSHEELKPSTLDRLKKMLVPDYTLYNTFKDNLDRRLSNTYSNFTTLLQNFKESRAKVSYQF